MCPNEVFIQNQQIFIIDSLRVESGVTLKHCPIAYNTWGCLNAAADNVILVCHALTGSSDVESWWGPLLGSGKVFDTNLYFVVCANVLGSPYGSASPLTIAHPTQLPYGTNFPYVSIRDSVEAQYSLLLSLGVNRVKMAVGGSMGGMLVLEWALMKRNFVESIVPIATSGRSSAWCIGWGHCQRQTIMNDPNFLPPNVGLAAARIQALLTYRSKPSFDARFNRTLSKTATPSTSVSPVPSFSVQTYLKYQGEKFSRRFDANCYLTLLDTMDSHDLSRDKQESYEKIVRSIQQPALIVGIDSDALFPLDEQVELHRLLPNSELVVLKSEQGHDGFLIEFEKLSSHIASWLSKSHVAE